MPMLKPGGLFIALFPNGSENCRAVDPSWSKYWGESHPNMIDEVFLNRIFGGQPRLYASESADQTKNHRRHDVEAFSVFRNAAYPGALYADDLGHYEMYFATRK